MDDLKKAKKMLIFSIICVIVTLIFTIYISSQIILHLLVEHYAILLLLPLGIGFMLAFDFSVLLAVDSLYEYQELNRKD